MASISIKNYILFLLFVFVYATAILPAQTTYSLADCNSAALANNYDLLLTKYQKDYDTALMQSAFGAYLPTINANAGYTRMLGGNVNDNMLNSWSLMFNANLLLYDGGKREVNYQLAKNQSKLTDLQNKYLIEQLKLNVYTQFVNIISLEETAKARREDIEASRIQLENLQARFEAGAIAEDLVLSQEADLGNKEILLLNAEININTAKQNLLITMGLDPSMNTNFVDTSISDKIDDSQISAFRDSVRDLQTLIKVAFDNRIDYSSEILTKENADYSRKTATGNYYPSLSASFGYGLNSYNLDNIKDDIGGNLGLNLNIPIFSNYSTDLQVEQYELSYQQSNTALLKLEQNIRSQVQTAYLNLNAAEKSIAISAKSLAAAERNFLSYKEKMNAGSATITDYITANTQYITAEINQISSVYSYLAAKRNLLFAIGRY
jgi:outer membrane protein